MKWRRNPVEGMKAGIATQESKGQATPAPIKHLFDCFPVQN
jgi:hypothetical protein